MMKSITDDEGFSLVELVIILLVITIVCVSGWLVYSRNHTNKNKGNSLSSVLVPEIGPSTTWKTYTNQQANLTFSYPSNWTSVSSEEPLLGGSFAGIYGTITSPSGHKLIWVYQVVGGKGADCTPNSGDVAFTASSDGCQSKQILSVTPTGKTLSGDFSGEGLYLTETKYFSPTDTIIDYPTPFTIPAKTTAYQICLDPYYPPSDGGQLPTVGTTIGFLFPCAYWDTGFNAMFSVSNEASFSSTDAYTAIQIMKTFSST